MPIHSCVFDGYYVMMDVLEIPNLRQKANQLLQRTAAHVCLGLEMPDDPFMPKTRKGWFISYAIASWCYRWFYHLWDFVISLHLFETVQIRCDQRSDGHGYCRDDGRRPVDQNGEIHLYTRESGNDQKNSRYHQRRGRGLPVVCVSLHSDPQASHDRIHHQTP